MSNLKKKVKSVEKRVRTFKVRIEFLTQQEGESIDSALQDDLLSVMEENNRSIMDAYPKIALHEFSGSNYYKLHQSKTNARSAGTL